MGGVSRVMPNTLGKATVPFDDSVLHCDFSILKMVPNVEGDPLRVVLVQLLLGNRYVAHRECSLCKSNV